MTNEKLQDILSAHKKWLNGEDGGVKADLRGADLMGANLRYAELMGADFRYAELMGADLMGADLRDAELRRANLMRANLRDANLDFSCLPLWCGGQFKADEHICKQLVAHTVKIMELSEIDQPELIAAMNAYKKGWHREDEF